MRLIIKDNENDLIISSDWITVIEIENKRLFSSYVRSLYALVNGRTPEKDIFLFEGSVELKLSKEVMYVTDPLVVDYNSRAIITALQKRVEDIKNNEIELWNYNEDLFVSFSESIIHFLNEVELDLEYNTKFDVASIFKILNVKISESDSSTHLEKLYKLIDILTEINIFKVVFFFNLKSLLEQDEITGFYTYCLYKKFPIVLFESRLEEIKLYDEHKLVIDSQFEEYLYE